MNQRESIERVLVAVDMSSERLQVCEAAALLAFSFGVELSGILVENEALLQSADLPLTREFSLGTSVARACDRHTMESQLRVRAKRARQAFEAIAGRVRVSWSFEVRRVSLFPNLQWQGPSRTQSPVIALVSGGDRWETAIDVAARIAATEMRVLEVLVIDGDPTLEPLVRARLAGLDLQIEVRSAGSLARLLSHVPPRARVVVVPAQRSHLRDPAELANIVDLFGAPIVVSR